MRSWGAPDLICFNGDFRTQDPQCPRAQALAVQNGRIAAIGQNSTIRSLAGPRTQSLNLNQRLGLPGIIDTHFHFFEWALNRANIDLAAEESFEACMQSIAAEAACKPPGQWLVAQGFNESDWPENRMPLAKDLDRAAPSNPVVIWRCDLHLAVANSTALDLAGIHRGTPDPPQGAIEKDGQGRPTGVLRELAINRVKDVIPMPSHQQAARCLAEAIPAAHELGLTGIHDVRLMGGKEGASALNAWQLCQQNEALNLRTWVTLPGEALEAAIGLGLRSGLGDDRLRIGHVKYFADGGMGARTAWVIERYRDADFGMPLTPVAELKTAIAKAERHGLAVMIHAVGDRANREIIRAFGSVLRHDRSRSLDKARERPLPHRIEHVQMIRPTDIARMARLGIMASVQPANLLLDINMIDACLGEKGKHAYPFRSLIDAGIEVCFSSDAPVCNPNPLLGIHAAVTRRRADGTPSQGWYPDQCLKVADAVDRYTRLPSIISGAGRRLGTISTGKLADFIVLDRHIYAIDPEAIHRAKVVLTVFNGQVVFQSQDMSA